MNPAVATILGADQTRLCSLVSLDFGIDDFLRVNTSGVNLVWDSNTYFGLGQLGQIATAQESRELQSYDISFSLYTQSTAVITQALNANYNGNVAYLWLAALNSDYEIEDDPLLVFAGRMWNMEMSLGKESSISIVASSRLSDWENAHGGRYNAGTQKSKVDSVDQGFDLVTVIANQEIIWGTPGTSIPGRFNPNPNPPSRWDALKDAWGEG
jgi:hypothetical protein